MKRRDLLGGAAALAAAAAFPAEAAPAATAASELTRACADAASSGRRTLLVFHASWCVYCRQLDVMLDHAEAGPIMARHFLVLHMRVQETSKRGKAMQLPGAEKVFKRFAPEEVGLPYFLVLDEREKKLVDSVMPDGANIGFPVSRQELDAFDALLRAGAPAITAEEIAVVRRVCASMARKL